MKRPIYYQNSIRKNGKYIGELQSTELEFLNDCWLTYEELEYFYYELSQINMHNLGLFVIMTDLLLSNQTTYNSPRELVIPKVMEEVKADEVVEKSTPLNKPPNTIPDI